LGLPVQIFANAFCVYQKNNAIEVQTGTGYVFKSILTARVLQE